MFRIRSRCRNPRTLRTRSESLTTWSNVSGRSAAAGRPEGGWQSNAGMGVLVPGSLAGRSNNFLQPSAVLRQKNHSELLRASHVSFVFLLLIARVSGQRSVARCTVRTNTHNNTLSLWSPQPFCLKRTPILLLSCSSLDGEFAGDCWSSSLQAHPK